MSWSGVPVNLLRAARNEWRVHRVDEPDDAVPLAVAFDNAEDPTNITAAWWIHVNNKFHELSGVRIYKESFAEMDAAPFGAALITWAAKQTSATGAVQELLRLV